MLQILSILKKYWVVREIAKRSSPHADFLLRFFYFLFKDPSFCCNFTYPDIPLVMMQCISAIEKADLKTVKNIYKVMVDYEDYRSLRVALNQGAFSISFFKTPIFYSINTFISRIFSPQACRELLMKVIFNVYLLINIWIFYNRQNVLSIFCFIGIYISYKL